MTSTSRRTLLLGAAALVSGCAVPGTGPAPEHPGQPENCRTPESLVDFSTLGGATLGYELGRTTTTYKADPRFVELLEAWAADWSSLSGLGAMTTIWSYGAYVDKCDSFHASGRAFDIAAVDHADGSISCRYDIWAPGSAAQNKGYWRLAASLHLHFGYTLTHLYDEAHHNHIHVDNAISAWGGTSFSAGSRVQVQMVQAACRDVFGAAVDITGSYDDQTRAALRPIQTSLGITRPLGDVDGWRDFLRSTASTA